jgi:hypothetical protein
MVSVLMGDDYSFDIVTIEAKVFDTWYENALRLLSIIERVDDYETLSCVDCPRRHPTLSNKVDPSKNSVGSKNPGVSVPSNKSV